MVSIFIFGVLLLSLSGNIESDIVKCTNEKVRNANRLLVITATTLIVGSISYLLCNWKCKTISQPTITLYMSFFIILGIGLIMIGQSIRDNASESECSKSKQDALSITLVGTLMVIMCVSYIVYITQQNKAMSAHTMTKS